MKLPFTLEPEDYSRDLNVANGWRKQAVTYLRRMTDYSAEECEIYIDKVTASGGKFEIKDPRIMALTKNTVGDRGVTPMSFNNFLCTATNDNLIISPSLTAYLPASTKEALGGKYLRMKKKQRAILKHAGFVASQQNNIQVAIQKHIEQSTAKTKMNSFSGGAASIGTPIYLKSNHPALTSTCRCGTAYGTATVEKFLCGNRHLYKPSLAVNNIVSLIHLTDYAEFESVMKQYALVYPTKDDVCKMIFRSTDLYWNSPIGIQNIVALVDNLDPVELAIIMYSNDFYNLAKLNENFARTFINSISIKGDGFIDDADAWIDGMDGDLKAIVSYMCEDELRGTTIRDVKSDNPKHYKIIASTAKHISEVLIEYRPMIHCFWANKNMPNSIPALSGSLRRCAVVSDTDSTIFTVEKWIEWFNAGEVNYNSKSVAVSHVLVFLSAQVLSHQLALYSTNMGIGKPDLHSFMMKNEFAYPTMIVTNKAKHYVSYQSACEGNVYKKLKYDSKGVALKSSKIPKVIMNNIEVFIKSIMDTFIAGHKISHITMQRIVASIEWDIYRSIQKADPEYLTFSKVKCAESYANPESSPFAQYGLWQEVFADKYGNAPEPEYAAIKISVDLNTKFKVTGYIKSLKDRDIARRLEEWLLRNDKKGLTQFLIPTDIARSGGIPQELVDACNVRKLIFANCEAFYLMLETLGLFMHNKDNTRLCMDLHPEENVEGGTILPQYMTVGAFKYGKVISVVDSSVPVSTVLIEDN